MRVTKEAQESSEGMKIILDQIRGRKANVLPRIISGPVHCTTSNKNDGLNAGTVVCDDAIGG